MDQGVKLAAACGVLLFGIVVALVIPRGSSQTDPNGARADDPVVPRGHAAPPLSSGPASQWPAVDRGATTPPAATHRIARPRVVAQEPENFGPMDPGGLPPDLARHYPQDAYSTIPRHGATSRWGASISLNPPKPVVRELTHTIVDGDTLEQLAERYLGTADRHLEIFEANRSVLASPQLLPIGKQLRIPPRGVRSQPITDVRTRRPMIPIGN
ncbi:MAG: LysM peptidoglycan-binding domain-containing protein [Thermoguttaceae bacterium]